MVNDTYANAYTEVLELMKYFSKKDLEKIPIKKINYYRENMNTSYHFSINPHIDFDKQNISQEAKAIIITLYIDYISTEEQKIKINEILKLKEQKEEHEKYEKYNPNDIFKNNKYKKLENTTFKNNSTTQLIQYNNNFYIKLKKFLFKLLHISKD